MIDLFLIATFELSKFTQYLRVFGIAVTILSVLALLYKMYIFYKLMKDDRMHTEYRNCAGFLKVLAYGKHLKLVRCDLVSLWVYNMFYY